MPALTISAAELFNSCYCACDGDPFVWLLDVRGNKEFKRGHLSQAFNVKVSANGRALVDYSQSSYAHAWSHGCWWDKHLILYSNEPLTESHPVAAHLVGSGKARSVALCTDSFSSLEKKFPFVVTTSVKSKGSRTYPTAIIDKHLYLGDWNHACDKEALKEQHIKHVVSIHNNPSGVTVAKHIADAGHHTRLGLADVPSEDIAKHFDAAFAAIDRARHLGEGVLVHCGAGVSRSATLCAMYLMRRERVGPRAAVLRCRARRSCVEPNPGFIAALRRLADALGVEDDTGAEDEEVRRRRGDGGGRAADGDDDGNGDAGDGGDAGGGGGWGEQLRRARGGGAREAAAAAAAGRVNTHTPSMVSGAAGAAAAAVAAGRAAAAAVKATAEPPKVESLLRGYVDDVDDADIADIDGSRRLDDGLPRMDVYKGGDLVETIPLHDIVSRKGASSSVSFGRDRECDVPLDHPSISRRHAELVLTSDGGCFAVDNGSAHGTFVDGERVATRRVALRSGSVIVFGGSTRNYVMRGVKVSSAGTGAAAAAAAVAGSAEGDVTTKVFGSTSVTRDVDGADRAHGEGDNRSRRRHADSRREGSRERTRDQSRDDRGGGGRRRRSRSRSRDDDSREVRDAGGRRTDFRGDGGSVYRHRERERSGRDRRSRSPRDRAGKHASRDGDR